MTTMKAWRFDRYGGPEVMEYIDLALPQPKAGEVLVKVLASGVNPSDVKNVSGHFEASIPRIPGRDFAGVIIAGDNREGEEVWGSGPGFGVTRDGTHAEYVTIPSLWVAAKPTNLSMAQAAAVGVPYLAAWLSLITAGGLRPDETVLVTGVSGAVGRAATQIAHRCRARVIGADRTEANPAGADVIVSTKNKDWVEEVRSAVHGRGVDMVLDAVGGVLFEPSLKTLRHGGRQVAITSNPQVVNFNLVDFYHQELRLMGVDTMALSGEDVAGIMNNLRNGFEDGSYQPPHVEAWPLTQAVAAYQTVRDGKQSVKHVLTMSGRPDRNV